MLTWIIICATGGVPMCFCPVDVKEVWIDPQGTLYEKENGCIIPPDPMDWGLCHPKPPPKGQPTNSNMVRA